jgi:hypothetical protein
MELKYYYLILAACCGVWNAITGTIIYFDLRARGEKVNFFLLRMMAPWYAHRYRKITREETGRTGPLFLHWIISINGALVFAVAAIVLHFTQR